MFEELGYRKILTFQNVPCEIYFHNEKAMTISVGHLGPVYWLKASKHFYIKAMETRNEAGLYSKLQQISAFMDYLKHNVPEFQCTAYYIGQLTPQIALRNFRALPQLQRYNTEHSHLIETLGDDAEERRMLEQLQLFRETGTHDIVAKQLELTLASREKLRERLQKLDAELRGAANVINEWVEKGHAVALLWTVSTNIYACNSADLANILGTVEDELNRIEKLSIRSRAHQQGLLIEELKEPWHMFYAEACGLFHPALLETYRDLPPLQELASSIETWMNARLTSPITRTGYSEQPSTGIAEALAAFLRQIQTIDQLPRKIGSRLTQRPLKKPIYMGFIATRSESRHQPSKEPYLIDLDDLREMTLVSGATGSGKTRVAQIIAEGASLYAPVIVIDPVGEFTGLIHTNMDASKERQFKLPNGISYEPEIYTLDDEGNQFSANLLLKPNIPEEFLATSADEVSLILTDLVGDIRFRDIFRETVLENWRHEKRISCEEFVETCKRKAQGLKTSVKLERLLQFKMLMSGEALDVEELLQKQLVVFSLNSHLYTDTQRLAVVWFILRQILNYFLSQPHSDSTRAVVIEDEVHRLYAEGAPRSAASVLENMVKQGRAKGLAVVLISQSLHDLPGILTQANLRVLLRILEGEIQSYGDKFGMALARSLHSLEPRFGYVFHGSEEFYCAFRPTLSMPKGVTDYQEIRNYTSSQKNLKRFLETVTTHSSAQTRKAEQVVSVLSEDELRVKESLESLGGTAQSKRQLAQLAGVKGREKILQVVSRLEEKGYVKTDKVGSAVVVKLLRK
jgi:hypothetical protein